MHHLIQLKICTVMGLSCMLQCFPGVLVEMGSGQEEGEVQSVSCWYVISSMELLGQFMVGRVLRVS